MIIIKKDVKLYSVINKNIKKIRKEQLKKTQQQFADEVGISASFVKQIENKKIAKAVSLDTLSAISRVYNIDIKEFFNGY